MRKCWEVISWVGNAVQLSLFDDNREKTDSQLIGELTNKADTVSDAWTGEYRLERLFNSLTPHRRRIAVAAVELYRRREVRRRDADALGGSDDIYNLMRPLIGDLPNEEFWVLALSRSSKVISKQRISVGAIDQTCVDIRLIMRVLIETGAVQFVAVHNHPSGNICPSMEDKKITERMNNAAALFNIRILDHVIITNDGYYSFNDEGLI